MVECLPATSRILKAHLPIFHKFPTQISEDVRSYVEVPTRIYVFPFMAIIGQFRAVQARELEFGIDLLDVGDEARQSTAIWMLPGLVTFLLVWKPIQSSDGRQERLVNRFEGRYCVLKHPTR